MQPLQRSRYNIRYIIEYHNCKEFWKVHINWRNRIKPVRIDLLSEDTMKGEEDDTIMKSSLSVPT
jgi:hypothetical protein